tara:strand:+ start:96 stop:536 length:441 start_codon:yes stop_codon:yes gene_type:complete
VAVGVAMWHWRRLVTERRMNQVISHGLEELMKSTRIEIEKNKKLVAKAKQLTDQHSEPHRVTNSNGDPMEDPALLATVVTVLINKYGTTVLGLKDFEAVGDDAYVSVYVDTSTQDLILSLDRNLADEPDPMSLLHFGNKKDDTTYH